MGPIGIIANPASKDIRRLVAHASVFDNQEKQHPPPRDPRRDRRRGALLVMPDSHGPPRPR
jgi:hypothetical protein